MSFIPNESAMTGKGTRCGVNTLGALIDEATAEARLKVQQQLVARRHRGNMQQLRTWSLQCPTLGGAVRNSGCVALLVNEAELDLVQGNHISGDAVYQARVYHYGGPPLNLRTSDFLYAEFAWDKPGGTGFLVSADRILTARHVIKPDVRAQLELGRMFVAFDFKTEPDGTVSQFFKLNQNLFRVRSEGPRGCGSEKKEDWATLILEHPVDTSQRAPAIIASSLAQTRAVYTLGHSQALAMRYAYSPELLPCSQAGCHESYVEGYCGGSGSPVFDAITHQVVGILTNAGASSEGADGTTEGDYVSQINAPELNSGGSLFIDSASFASGALARLIGAPAP
jgi:hypothetical protein